MNRIAHILSSLFTPLLIPTYGIVLALMVTTLYYVPTATKLLVTLTTLSITAVIPMLIIYILYRTGRITDVGLNSRRERTIPYAAALVSYAGAIVYLNIVHSPIWLLMFLAGGAIALACAMVINLWWKISAHAAGIAGLVALSVYILQRGLNVWPVTWIVMTLIVLAGAVCTSRLILQRHTLGQLAAGTALGFIAVFATMELFGN